MACLPRALTPAIPRRLLSLRHTASDAMTRAGANFGAARCTLRAASGPSRPRVFARVAPRVHRFFLSTFGEAALADDLLQVTFLKVHKARRQYRPQLPLLPWLFAVAARVRLRAFRRWRPTHERNKW